MQIAVKRTYLQMLKPESHRRSSTIVQTARIEQVTAIVPAFYRFLYGETGKNYHWTDRLKWTDAEIVTHLSDPAITLFVLYLEGAPAGFLELKKYPDKSVEIGYFGLLPEFVGRNLGGWFLSQAIDLAWKSKPERVWLHTCTLDDPRAMPNYIKRGFEPYRSEEYFTER